MNLFFMEKIISALKFLNANTKQWKRKGFKYLWQSCRIWAGSFQDDQALELC